MDPDLILDLLKNDKKFLSFKLLPDMPILGSSYSASNKDMMSKIWTNGDIVF